MKIKREIGALLEVMMADDEIVQQVRKHAQEAREHYEKDPSIRREFSRKYKTIDFIPVIGAVINENRAVRNLRKGIVFFTGGANDSFKSKLGMNAFIGYHYLTAFPIMALFFYLGEAL